MIDPPPLLHRRFVRRISPRLRAASLILGILVGVAAAWLLSRALEPANGLQVLAPTGDEEPVAATAGLEIRFSKPLDPQKFHEYIQIEPPIHGEWELEGADAIFRAGTATSYGTRATVLVSAGLPALDGSQLRADVAVDFRIREPLVGYLRRGGLTLIAESLGGDLQTLLASPDEIVEFAPSPDGRTIAYSAASGSGGRDLWLLDRETLEAELLLGCSGQVCGGLNWSPDGERLAFTRREPGQEVDLANPRIWTISIDDRAAAPLYQDERILGRDPVWSPDGLGLAFYDPGINAVRLLDLDTVREQIIASGSGRTGSWSPDSRSFVLARQQFGEESVTADLLIVDTETRQARLLTDSQRAWLDISRPLWSPDGEWIAFAGQSATAGLAKGLFLVRPDGSDLLELESQPGLSHGGYSWDPRGSMLLFQRFDLQDPQAVPVVAVWQLEGGNVLEIASEAFSPIWLP